MNNMYVIMICGAPASGKTSLTENYIKDGYVNLNRDTEGGTMRSLLPKMESLLKDNKNIVLDNLFVNIESRKPFIDLAKKYGAEINCLLLDTSIEDSQFNVVSRAIKLTGKFPTPELIKKAKHTNIFPPLVLFKYKKEFQKPSLEEGFSKVETISFIRKDDSTFFNKALILDYDGCLRDCIGGNGKYPVEFDHIKILPNRTEIIKKYKDNGYLLLGVSNQSGVHKGELTYEKADQLFDYTNKLLGIDIEYKFCPHQSNPISCYCRKPMCGLFIEFMLKYKLDRKNSIFVGDMTTDCTAAKRFGCKFIHANDFFNGESN